MARLLNALRDELVTAGIVRYPETGGGLPPFWREPKLGTPAPGEGNADAEVGQDAVVGAYLIGGLAPGPFESYRRDPFVELRFRTRLGYMAEELELQITGQLIDRRDFMLGGATGVHVLECQQILALQRLGSDEQGFEHLTQYQFELYRP